MRHDKIEILEATRVADGTFVVEPARRGFTVDRRYLKVQAGRTVRRYVAVFVAVFLTYLVGALISWELDPGQWNGIWRFWVFCWAAFWGLFAYNTKD